MKNYMNKLFVLGGIALAVSGTVMESVFARNDPTRNVTTTFAQHGNIDMRFATFNASLNRNNEGDLIADLSTPDNAQAKTVAKII